jgi:hypothetical protein
VLKSFLQFEETYGPGNRYAILTDLQISALRKTALPDYYIDYLQKEGLKEFNNGFWWFLNPLDEDKPLLDPPGSLRGKVYYPLLRNAFGGFVVFIEGQFYHADPQTQNFGLLGKQLEAVIHGSLLSDISRRKMYYGDFFDYASSKFGKIKSDEIYAFVPAPAFGGEFTNGNIKVVKLKEHLSFLAQLEDSQA